MNKTADKQLGRARRHARIRTRVSGSAEKPRLAVFRSNKFVYAQLIDDEAGKTLASADSRSVAGGDARERAAAVGKTIAEAAGKLGITVAVFDRGGFTYQGAIAALADGARDAGLKV